MIIRLAFRNLFRNIRRTLAVLTTVALGAAAIFTFEGFINGMLLDYKNTTIRSQYGHGQIFTRNYRKTAYLEPWKHWIDQIDEVIAFLNEQEEIEYIFPRVSFSALLRKDSKTVSGLGQGVEAEKEREFFSTLNIIDGEPLTTEEKGIMIGSGLARALDVEPGDTIELTVNGTDGSTNKKETEVTGIFKTGAQEFDNRIFRVQLPLAQDLLKTEKVELIALGLKKDQDWDQLAKHIEGYQPKLEAVAFNVLDKVYYQHSVNWLNAQFYIIQAIIVGIVLMGIINTVSTSIFERKKEIGNLRANGESKLHILLLILTEGGIMGAIGSIFGIALTYVIITSFLDKVFLMPPGPGLTRDVFVTFVFTWKMLFTTAALSIFSAILASLFAGYKVASMPISKALGSH